MLDADVDRRKVYGKAGAFRQTNYGHEYRTPSNFWIKNDKLRQWIFTQTQDALDFASNHADILMNDKVIGELIQDCINNHEENTADWLCNEFSIEVPIARQ